MGGLIAPGRAGIRRPGRGLALREAPADTVHVVGRHPTHTRDRVRFGESALSLAPGARYTEPRGQHSQHRAQGLVAGMATRSCELVFHRGRTAPARDGARAENNCAECARAPARRHV